MVPWQRKIQRRQRLHFHELPLGALPVAGDPPMHQIRDLLEPMISEAILRYLHDQWFRWYFFRDGPVENFLQVNRFWLGPKEVWSGSAGNNLGDRSRIRFYYQLLPPEMPLHPERRRRRLARPRRLFGWIAIGTKGGISLYLERPLGWKKNRFLSLEEK